jgi:pimeloyl-[acyl-carrier protein] methyl ester esterase
MSLHVETFGSGAPLLLIHGWGMHGGMWGSVAAKLAERFCVHVVDLPGHGLSRKPEAVGETTIVGSRKLEDASKPFPNLRLTSYDSRLTTHDLRLESIIQQLSAQFSEPLTVCGWSLGGQIALRWAMLEPHKIQRLALVSSTPCFVQQEDWPCAMAAETLAGFAAALTENYAQTLRRFLALQVRGSEQERELLASLRNALFSRGEPDLAALQTGLEILRDCDLRAALPGIPQPTLVIAGVRDTLTPLPASEYMVSVMSAARLATIEGAAHAPFLSHSEIFVEQLKNFLHE